MNLVDYVNHLLYELIILRSGIYVDDQDRDTSTSSCFCDH